MLKYVRFLLLLGLMWGIVACEQTERVPDDVATAVSTPTVAALGVGTLLADDSSASEIDRQPSALFFLLFGLVGMGVLFIFGIIIRKRGD